MRQRVALVMALVGLAAATILGGAFERERDRDEESYRAARFEHGEAQRGEREDPASQFARIRTWMRYGMTVAEVAQVYEVTVEEIERNLQKT